MNEKDKEQQALIQVELARLRAGPQQGTFTFLHHEGPLCEPTENLDERLDYILRIKSFDESLYKILTRLRHIWFVSKPLANDYNAKCKPLVDDYNAKRKPLDDDYNAKRNALDDYYYAKRTPLANDYYAKRNALDNDYNAKCKPLVDDYNAKCKPLDDELIAKVGIKNCGWDGRTIFGAIKETQDESQT